MVRHLLTAPLVLLTGACAAAPADVSNVVDAYLERYFEFYPSRATAAGRHEFDAQLEQLTDDRVRDWVRYQDEVEEALRDALAQPGTSDDDRLDAEVLVQQAERERLTYAVLRRHERDPLFWTAIAADAAVHLTVHAGRPARNRAADALQRVARIPALAALATQRMTDADADQLSPETCRIAASQAQAAAAFYRSGFLEIVAEAGLDGQAQAQRAADALATLGNRLDELSLKATGSPALGRQYTRTFQVVLGTTRAPREVLDAAEADLVDLRREAAAYGRSVWPEVMGTRPLPANDRALLRALFDRVSADRDEDLITYRARWEETVTELVAFVRNHRVVTLPDPMHLEIVEAPPYFVRQAVGDVFVPGPYASDAPAFLFLPVPRADATDQQRTAFFRAFNVHFNRMIAPHELVPGHLLQAMHAARHPRRVRALFPDPLYVEGWGTLCERLMLDLGWGGPLPRLAHLRKQLENAARVVADVRVHTMGATRADIVRFVREEALQDEQFASSLWTRVITSSPQIVTYHLGYREMRELYDATRRAEGERFELQRFMDDMLALGPVAVRHYRTRQAQYTRRP
jgi:uncharacterized protein (DUF885 family)